MMTVTLLVLFAFLVLGVVAFFAAQIAGSFRELGHLLKSGLSDFRDDPVGTLKSIGRYYRHGATKFFVVLWRRAKLLYLLRKRYGWGRIYGFRPDDPRLIEYWVGGSALYSTSPGQLNGSGKMAKILSFGFNKHGFAVVQLRNTAGDVFTRSAADLRPAH